MRHLCSKSGLHQSLTTRLVITNVRNTHRIHGGLASMSSHTTATTTPQQPIFSKGTNEAAATSALGSLLSSSGGRWSLVKEGEALERTFKFKTFAKTWDFMTSVSLQCKLKNHHPEWSNVYNTTFIRWTTHNPKGLSDKDIALAAICDSIAKDFGEMEPEPASCAMTGLADKVVEAGGDCCTPKR